MPLTDEIFDALSESNETASVSFFLTLLRSTPVLHQWLRVATLTPAIFERLTAIVEQKLEPPAHARSGCKLLAWLAHADDRTQETAFLRQQTADIAALTYGGLTHHQLFALVRRYQAGHHDTSAFMLAHAWRGSRSISSFASSAPRPVSSLGPSSISSAFSSPSSNSISPPIPSVFPSVFPSLALLNATALYLQSGLTEDRPQLLHHLAQVAHFFHNRPPGSIGRKHFGHTDWWRLNILHYMLHHPKPSYRTGEFLQHLQTQKITVDHKEIRRFCTRHSIARNTSPGRPKKGAK